MKILQYRGIQTYNISCKDFCISRLLCYGWPGDGIHKTSLKGNTLVLSPDMESEDRPRLGKINTSQVVSIFSYHWISPKKGQKQKKNTSKICFRQIFFFICQAQETLNIFEDFRNNHYCTFWIFETKMSIQNTLISLITRGKSLLESWVTTFLPD